MFVFPANDDGYRKRKKSYKACEQCKRGRRRCQASAKSTEGKCAKCYRNGISCSFVSPGVQPSQASPEPDDTRTSTNAVINPPQEPRPFTLIGREGLPTDTMPALVEASPKIRQNAPQKFISNLDPTSDLVVPGELDNDKVGFWVSKGLDNLTTRRTVAEYPALTSHLLVYLNTLRVFEFPPETERQGLIGIYFRFINSVLPIIEEKSFMRQYAKGEHSMVLLHCIILAACRHFEAGAFLHGAEPRNFAALIHRKIQALLYAEMEQDELTLVRVYGLLSMQSEGPEGLNAGAKDLAVAFHYAHSLGIHLRRPRNTETDELQMLWTSLWCLDRMSACVNGKPFNSNPRDVGLAVVGGHATHERVAESCKGLDVTIELYRPTGPLVFPNLTLTAFDQDEPLARLINCVAVILSHRARRSLASDSVNRILIRAACDILEIIETVRDLAPLPIVPYGVSLTLTVFLRLYPEHEARTGWRRSCTNLDSLGKYWWIAEAMASMGRCVFYKLEDDYNAISDIFLGDTSSSVLDQASLFGELDKEVMDYWFPNLPAIPEI